MKLGRLTPAQLSTLALTVIDRMTGNALYAAPEPTLIDMATAQTTLNAAIVARGTKRNKGSASDTVSLSSAVATMKEMLVSEAKYVMNTTPYDKDALVSTGFVIKGKKHISKRLQAVRNATAKVSRALNADQVLITWKKGLGGIKANDVKIYHLHWNNSPNFKTSVKYNQTTEGKVITNFSELTQKPVANGDQIYFWVVGQNGKGLSVVSNIITARFVDLGA